MNFYFSIRVKLSFIFFVLIFIILIIFNTLFAIYSRRQNYQKTIMSGIHFQNKFISGFERQLEQVELEIKGVKHHFESQKYQEEYLKTNKFKNLIHFFLKEYAYKYSKIIVIYHKSQRGAVYAPLKIFGGDTKITEKSLSRKEIIKSITLGSGKKNQRHDISVDKSEANILVSTDFIEGYTLFFLARLDYMVSRVVNQEGMDPKYQLLLTDSTGIILYSKDKLDYGKLIKRTFDEKLIKGEDINDSTSHYITYGKAVFIKSFPDIPLKFILRENTLSLHESWKINMLRLAAFSFLFLIISTSLVLFVAKKITSSILIITRKAKEISEGRFDSRISLKRNDELRQLAESFNIMSVRLNHLYGQLRDKNKILQDKIIELNKTKAELTRKQKLALIGETISKISHEIQNRIGAIDIWVQNLEMSANNEDDKQEYINEIKSCLTRFMIMLTDFKKFYRNPSLNKKPSDINETIIDSLLDIRADYTAKEIKMKLDLDQGIPLFAFDKEQIKTVLYNILINAVYYTPFGGIIEIKTQLMENNIEIHIIDSGPGVKSEIQDKIFLPFFSEKTSGSGLGLAISHSVIQAHQGKLKCLNLKERGCQFTILLPGE